MSENNGYTNNQPFPPILPDLDDWPIVQISQNKEQIIEEVTEETLHSILEKNKTEDEIHDVLAKAIYLEKMRISGKRWKIDPKDDIVFWNTVKEQLIEFESRSDDKITGEKDVLRQIIYRYAHEITGNFKKRTYHFAKRFVPFAFNRLLNASHSREFRRVFKNQVGIHKRIHLVGETDQVRELAKNGTVIVVPTHSSNIDSITIGWAIDAIGLPAFLYGAGLNLFSVKFLAYFMNRMGAYKIDRRKKNNIYLETLKTYSTNVIMKGGHSLFFPGGTRSRSGMLEDQLKLGLLGTALEAQRRNIINNSGKNFKKIFVCPVTLNYSFILEAPVLIDEHLRHVGKERYFVESDKYSSSYNMIKFLLRFFSASADFTIAFGRCMDIFGNEVDMHGRSLDNNGNEIDITDYFRARGELKYDTQRDSEYTRMLSEGILHAFKTNNVALPGHVVAFAAFRIFQKKHHSTDLYSVLRMPEEFREIPKDEFRATVLKLQHELIRLEKKHCIRLDPIVHADVDELIDYGVKNLGIYHSKKPLVFNKQTGAIRCRDMKLLLFYHNRLEGYDLEKNV